MRVPLAAAAALSLYGCDWLDNGTPASRAQAAKAPEQVRSECASRLTYSRLKEYVFDEAASIRNSDPRRLDQVAAYSVVRMEQPVVKSRDDHLNITVCTGRFVLNLPPGVQDAFDGQPFITADVEYAAQAAADGSGLVYSMTGAEPIIYRIATLGLRPLQPVQIAESPAPIKPDLEKSSLAPQATTQESKAPAPSKAKEARVETVNRAAERPRAPVQQAKSTASPSFKCRYAKTTSEKMVCRNGSLAAADRRMSAVFYSEMANASAETKRALRRSRDRFLARRERCTSEACVARVYEERVAEIRRIGS